MTLHAEVPLLALSGLVLPQFNTDCMQISVDEITGRYPNNNIVMVLNAAGWHKCRDFHLPGSLRLLFLPPCSLELNSQGRLREEIREKYFHNRVFDSLDTLEDRLVDTPRLLENNPDRVKSITASDWIINAVSIAK